jgi:PAS domain S-box-containing protein
VADSARQLQRETSDRLEQVFESITDGVAVLNRDWIFTYVNRAGQQIIGPSLPIAGRRYRDVFPEHNIFEENYREGMAGRRSEFVAFYAPLGLWTSVRVFPTPEGIVIFFQDITQQRRAEQALDNSARRLRQALDAGALGTWSWDMATDRLDLDDRAAELLFAEPHSPVLRTELRKRIVLPDDLAASPDNLSDIVHSGRTYSSEYRIEGPGKTQRWIAARGLPYYNEAHEVTGIIGTVQDITARKTQEATLRQSEKLAATGRLAATIAHEINNPLEAVTNLIYLAKTDPTIAPSVQRLLETADEELARVAQIAQQTLGFYRDTTRPSEIDLSAMLYGIIELFARKLAFKRLVCRPQIQSGLRVFGLQGEIRQVFSNLLVNATDASEDSEIIIRARNRIVGGKPGVSCIIADRGTGSRPSSHPKSLSAPASACGSLEASSKSTAAQSATEREPSRPRERSSASFFPPKYPRSKFSIQLRRIFSSRLSAEIAVLSGSHLCTRLEGNHSSRRPPCTSSGEPCHGQDPRDEPISLQQSLLESSPQSLWISRQRVRDREPGPQNPRRR